MVDLSTVPAFDLDDKLYAVFLVSRKDLIRRGYSEETVSSLTWQLIVSRAATLTVQLFVSEKKDPAAMEQILLDLTQAVIDALDCAVNKARSLDDQETEEGPAESVVS